MNYPKILAAAAITAAALMACVGTASATVATSNGSSYTSTFAAASSRHEFHGSFLTFSCTSASLEGKVEGHGASVTAEGKLSKWSFTECNYPVTVNKPGKLSFHATSGGNATLTSSGLEIAYHSSVGECIITTNATDIGTLTGGTGAKLDIGSASIPRTGGSFFCGSSIVWTGSYSFSTPTNLSFD